MLSGTFDTMPFADLLQWIGDARRSGTLTILLDLEERYFRFIEGRIVGYGSDDPMARDLGRLCLREGLLDEDRLLAAIRAQGRSQMPLSDVLAAEGIVDADRLEDVVHRHVTEIALSLFLWPDGKFTFSTTASAEAAEWMPPEYELARPLEGRAILMEGMRRLDEWNRIVKVLPSDEVRLIALKPAPELPILEEIAAHPEPPTLGELLIWKGDSRFLVCEQLFRAVERGALAFEAPSPGAPTRGARGTTSVAHLCDAARSLAAAHQHEEAAALLRTALAADPFRADARAQLAELRIAQRDALYEDLSRQRTVSLRRGRTAPPSLSPRDRKMLERINGRWDVQALAATSGLDELEALRSLKRLHHAGLIELGAP